MSVEWLSSAEFSFETNFSVLHQNMSIRRNIIKNSEQFILVKLSMIKECSSEFVPYNSLRAINSKIQAILWRKRFSGYEISFFQDMEGSVPVKLTIFSFVRCDMDSYRRQTFFASYTSKILDWRGARLQPFLKLYWKFGKSTFYQFL